LARLGEVGQKAHFPLSSYDMPLRLRLYGRTMRGVTSPQPDFEQRSPAMRRSTYAGAGPFRRYRPPASAIAKPFKPGVLPVQLLMVTGLWLGVAVFIAATGDRFRFLSVPAGVFCGLYAWFSISAWKNSRQRIAQTAGSAVSSAVDDSGSDSDPDSDKSVR